MKIVLNVSLDDFGTTRGVDVIKALRESMAGKELFPLYPGMSGIIRNGIGEAVGFYGVVDETECAVCGKPAASHGYWSVNDPSTHPWQSRQM